MSEDVLTVTLGHACRREQEYVVDLLLREFLGLEVRIDPTPDPSPVVTIRAAGRSLRLPQVLLRDGEPAGLAGRYPPPTCRRLDVAHTGLPADAFGGPDLLVLYGAPSADGAWISPRPDDARTLHVDVLGGSFFSVTRLEEVGAGPRDEHDRFPPRATTSWEQGLLTRAVVDEYTNLLWHAMQGLWPRMRRCTRSFTVRVSHDVDRPWAYDHRGLRDRLWVLREHARRGVLPRLGGSRAVNAMAAAAGLPHRDPFDTFDPLMDAAERRGLRATFYVLCGGSTSHDGRYDIRAKPVRRLLRRIAERGHEIGLHGSYATMDDPERLRGERDRLVCVLEQEGLSADVRACRQHYLRWQAPATWRAQEAAGIAVDASAGFSEAAGFRSGTSFEHPVFDVEARRTMELRERPLHIMDRALAGLEEDDALTKIDEVRTEVRRHGGSLGLLWHNNVFADSPLEWRRYRHAMAQAA